MSQFSRNNVSIEQLDLDVSNPRFKPETNQTEAMRNLLSVEKDGEKVLELASDICRVGGLDPAESLYVMESETPGRYIVLDGNRRLTALRLLSQPTTLDREELEISPAIRNRFKKLHAEFFGKWPQNVDVVISPNREAARHFIHLRHTGENAGAGRSAWSALQIARFDNTGTWQCIEKLRENNRLNLDVTNRIDSSAFEITNFERIVLTREFQAKFGFKITSTSVEFTNEHKAMLALSIVAEDVVSQRVHTRGEFDTVNKMQGYFSEVEAKVDAKMEQEKSKQYSHQNSGSSGKQGSPKGNTQERQNQDEAITPHQPPSDPGAKTEDAESQNTRKPRKRKYVAEKSDITSITNRKCHEIFRELREGVAVESAPYACALLIRSLLEITCEIYVKTVMDAKAKGYTTNISTATGHLLGSSYSTDSPDKATISESFKASAETYEQLCATAHNQYNELSAEHVKATWGSVRGGLDLLWKRIHHKEQANTKKNN